MSVELSPPVVVCDECLNWIDVIPALNTESQARQFAEVRRWVCRMGYDVCPMCYRKMLQG
jgi:hypothetical protein